MFGHSYIQFSPGGNYKLTQRDQVEPLQSPVVPFDQLSIPYGNSRISCPVCFKVFFVKKDFKFHYMTHTGEKPYPCPLCDYRARKVSALYQHVRMIHKMYDYKHCK